MADGSQRVATCVFGSETFFIEEENVFNDSENFILEVFQFAGDYTEMKKLEFVNEDDPLTADHVDHFFNRDNI